MIEVIGLLLGQRGFAAQVAHVERPLDIVLDARARQGDAGKAAGTPSDAQQVAVGFAVDEVLLAVGVVPVGGFERLQFVPGQMILGPLPDDGGLGNMSVAVKGRIIFGHGCKLLDGHTAPRSAWTVDDPQAALN